MTPAELPRDPTTYRWCRRCRLPHHLVNEAAEAFVDQVMRGDREVAWLELQRAVALGASAVEHRASLARWVYAELLEAKRQNADATATATATDDRDNSEPINVGSLIAVADDARRGASDVEARLSNSAVDLLVSEGYVEVLRSGGSKVHRSRLAFREDDPT